MCMYTYVWPLTYVWHSWPLNNAWVMTPAAAAKSLHSSPTLCDPIDGSPPGSPIPGILQARTLEWVAISFPNAWKWKVKVTSLGHVRLFVTPWTAAPQVPLPMGFSRQEYWSGVPLPSPMTPRACKYLPTFMFFPLRIVLILKMVDDHIWTHLRAHFSVLITCKLVSQKFR